MMNEEEQRAMILDFERNRQLLSSISAQKQQVSFQLEMVNASLEEMGKTSEKTVYKVVGNVLFPKNIEDMKKELTEKKESTELRMKTVEKQEENVVKKLNTLRAKLESEMKTEKEKPVQEEKKSKK
jgi:prefoldin beta subunit